MPDDYTPKFHPKFFDDLERLNEKEKEIVSKQIEKIKRDPTRFKRMHGTDNCYRIRIANLRIVYYLAGKTICFLVVERRKIVYGIYFRRLLRIKRELGR
jgi:mRNA-degrading endonuclease RelE of RelBE toxin-antitoxin system